MTRDEIMQLTPEQLRVEIAKAKGCIIRKYDAETWAVENPEITGILQTLRPRLEDALDNECIPNYPADIAAAWELFLEMAKTLIVKISNGDGDSCDIDILKPYEIFPAREEPFRIGLSGVTFPDIISRAWLIWKEEG